MKIFFQISSAGTFFCNNVHSRDTSKVPKPTCTVKIGTLLNRMTPGGGGGGGGGGGALRYRGGAHLRYVFRGGRGLSLRPPHVRDFVKEGYFFVPRYEVWVSKSPYNPRNIRGSDAK